MFIINPFENGIVFPQKHGDHGFKQSSRLKLFCFYTNAPVCPYKIAHWYIIFSKYNPTLARNQNDQAGGESFQQS